MNVHVTLCTILSFVWLSLSKPKQLNDIKVQLKIGGNKLSKAVAKKFCQLTTNANTEQLHAITLKLNLVLIS